MSNDKANIDRFGHCVVCHKAMIITQIIDEKEQVRFTPDYDTTQFLLDNGSMMKVAICKSCKNDVTENDYNIIMEAVINGWDLETRYLVKDPKKSLWDEARRKKYMDEYSKRKIIFYAEGKPKDVVDKKLKEYKKEK